VKRWGDVGAEQGSREMHGMFLTRVRLLRAFNLFKKDHHSSAPSSLSARLGGGGEGIISKR